MTPQTKHALIIVCSTTGNAEAPENADRFTRWIKRKTTRGDQFGFVAYSVLGLGDSNYDVFCAAAKVSFGWVFGFAYCVFEMAFAMFCKS